MFFLEQLVMHFCAATQLPDGYHLPVEIAFCYLFQEIGSSDAFAAKIEKNGKTIFQPQLAPRFLFAQRF